MKFLLIVTTGFVFALLLSTGVESRGRRRTRSICRACYYSNHPVCSIIGGLEVTFTNRCMLDYVACHNRHSNMQDIKFSHDGKCRDAVNLRSIDIIWLLQHHDGAKLDGIDIPEDCHELEGMLNCVANTEQPVENSTVGTVGDVSLGVSSP